MSQNRSSYPSPSHRPSQPTLKPTTLSPLFDAAGGTTFSGAVTESVASADAVSALAVFVSSITEAASASDSSSASAIFPVTITEAVAASETESATVVFASSITEAVSASDSTDAIIVVNVSESVSAADATTATAVFVSSITEAVSASDAESVVAVFVGSATESVAASDSESATAVFVASITEAVSAAETSTAGMLLISAITEPVTAAETEAASAVFAGADSESVTAAETESALATFVVARTEPAAASDTSGANAVFNVAVAEAVAAADATDGSKNATSYNDSVTEAVSAQASTNATLISGQHRSRKHHWAKFEPYVEARVTVQRVSARFAPIRRVTAAADKRGGAVQVYPVFGAFATVRNVQPMGGARIEVQAQRSYGFINFDGLDWRGEHIVSVTPVIADSAVLDVRARAGCTVMSFKRLSVARFDVARVTAKAIRNPTDEELVAMALAARRGFIAAKKRASIPRNRGL